jgi:hypothetical protein
MSPRSKPTFQTVFIRLRRRPACLFSSHTRADLWPALRLRAACIASRTVCSWMSFNSWGVSFGAYSVLLARVVRRPVRVPSTAGRRTPSLPRQSDAITFLIGASSESMSQLTFGRLSIPVRHFFTSANCRELRSGEVRRISLPRTRVNKAPEATPLCSGYHHSKRTGTPRRRQWT